MPALLGHGDLSERPTFIQAPCSDGGRLARRLSVVPDSLTGGGVLQEAANQNCLL